jgi:phosphopentomutase
LLLFYVPLNLRGKVKKQMKTNEAWQHPIHYTFDENGVTTSVADQHATIPWNQLYKLVSTKRMVLIYGGRIRANVVPRDQMGDAYDRLYEMAKERMDSYRFKMKK